MPATVHRALKDVAFNVNSIMSSLHSYMTNTQPCNRFFVPYHHCYQTDCNAGLQGRTAVAVRKGIPHAYVCLPQLFW